jgi:nicotinamidase/pyrazinamidase
MPQARIQADDALIVVDVQRDFCAGGALPIPHGDEVVGPLNEWIAAARAVGARVFLTRDRHPPRHVSFQTQGGPWPPHCVQNSQGAGWHPKLTIPPEAVVISKGVSPGKDNYSGFDDTDLADQLRRAGVRRLWVGGLALDFCVRATVLDARQLGLTTYVLESATRPVDAGAGRSAVEEMRAAGAIVDSMGPYEPNNPPMNRTTPL